MPADPRVADLVQSGKIRVAIFLPQYIKEADGALRGIGVGFVAMEVGRTLAERLGVQAVMVENPTPIKAIEGLKAGACDVACLGIEPSRIGELDFTAPVVQFDYTLLVPERSPIGGFADADRPGARIAVVANHASTFALTRKAQHAELIGRDLPDDAFDLLRSGKADAFAAPREQLLDYAALLPGSRVLDDSYGVNNAGLAIRKGQPERLAFLREFVEAAKASGLIAEIIARGRLRGFRVAPNG
jgi:polar amino acid transport system substrate-binding protein